MRKFSTLLLLCLAIGSLSAQHFIERHVLSCFSLTGGTEIMMSSTAGQAEFQTISSQNNWATQGFQQPCTHMAMAEFTVTLDECTDIYTIELGTMDECLQTSPHIYWNNVEGGLVLENATGRIHLEIHGELGCHFHAYINMDEVVPDEIIACEQEIYELITPNDDGANDDWVIELISTPGFEQNHVAIFNRWGLEVWSATNYDNHNTVWKGRSNTGEALPDGTYFYTVEAGGIDFTGFVELQR